MAFISEARKDTDSPWQICVCLDKKDCKMLMEAIGKVVAKHLRSYEYYKGVMVDGDPTSKQEDKYWEAEEAYDTILTLQEIVIKYLDLTK